SFLAMSCAEPGSTLIGGGAGGFGLGLVPTCMIAGIGALVTTRLTMVLPTTLPLTYTTAVVTVSTPFLPARTSLLCPTYIDLSPTLVVGYGTGWLRTMLPVRMRVTLMV